MRAIILSASGEPPVLRTLELETPVQGQREVAIALKGHHLAAPLPVRIESREAPRATAARKKSAQIEHTLPLREAPQTHELFESATFSGKIMLAVDGKNG